MTENVRVRYEIDLSVWRPRPDERGTMIRRLDPADQAALARLLLDAYVGTVDYEGETLPEATKEIVAWLRDSPMLDHSYGAVVAGHLVSAVLMMAFDDAPVVRALMTAPAHKGAGLGRAVTEAALASLRGSRYESVVLYITKGNTPSERLFTAAGAVPTDMDQGIRANPWPD